MSKQFGVITIKNDNGALVIFEGLDKELFDILDVIKENISETAEVKLLNKDEYDNCKDNIVELNKLLM